MGNGSHGGRRAIEAPEGHLLVGVLHKPHGLGGEISVELLSDVPERFDPGSELVLSVPEPAVGGRPRAVACEPHSVIIHTSRHHLGRWLITFEGCESRDDAEELRGAVLSIPETDAIVSDGQVLVHRLIGLKVLDATGADVGTVTAVLDYPAQDILEIETPAGSRMIPLVAELISDVDVDAGHVKFDPSVDPDVFFGTGGSRT